MNTSSLHTVLDVVLGITPVPGLSAAFHILKLIVSAVQQASKTKGRLVVLTQSAAQLLETLNAEFTASRISESTCVRPLRDLHSLLTDIQSFVQEEQARPFFKAVWNQDTRMEGIDAFHRRIGTVADAFQISALLDIQRMLASGDRARPLDNETVSARLKIVENNQMQLLRRLETPGTAKTHTQGAPKRKQVIIHGDPQYNNFRNRSPHPVVYNDKEYPTAEHLFQAFKYMEHRPDISERIRTLSKSGKRVFDYSMTQLHHQHPDWHRLRTAKMEIVQWHKFTQHPELKAQLLATGKAELVHSSKHKFWGVGEDQQGKNELGKALERVRSSLRAK
ncbi:hypothetical protein B0H16DRAFT_1535954 [Mycena metata]|uniref:NADAR domain-containing protein n=1 Tax=Mycena metata TaxID=1033252 RepID=A0AAD7NE90_9AGAR|nr:hypothetical protein B0H16DRAFT_1535954 [Mycena metata]